MARGRLPSSFRGGALEIQHGGETATYRGSKQALSLVAFYSDCRHQVRPVTSGHRIVLTDKLLLRRQDAAAGSVQDTELVGDLARCLEEHFGASQSPIAWSISSATSTPVAASTGRA